MILDRLMTLIMGFCLMSVNASATTDSNCRSTPDLSDGLGPIYNQGDDINSCFAFVAADQLTQKMHRTGALSKNDRIQPLALWALYTTDDARIPNDSKGFVSTPTLLFDSLESLRRKDLHMLCTESEFGASVDSRNPLFEQAESKERIKFQEQLHETLTPTCRENGFGKQHHELKKLAYLTWWNAIKDKCHTKIPKVTQPFFWYPSRYDALSKNEVPKGPPGQTEVLAKKIDSALENGEIPAIEYQRRVIKPNDPPVMHWSSIVARQMKNGRCYYKIRNSEGADCSRYRDPKLCEGGYVWVEKYELLSHTDAVSYLSN